MSDARGVVLLLQRNLCYHHDSVSYEGVTVRSQCFSFVFALLALLSVREVFLRSQEVATQCVALMEVRRVCGCQK